MKSSSQKTLCNKGKIIFRSIFLPKGREIKKWIIHDIIVVIVWIIVYTFSFALVVATWEHFKNPIGNYVVGISVFSGWVFGFILAYIIYKKYRNLKSGTYRYGIVIDTENFSIYTGTKKHVWKLTEIEYIYIDEECSPIWGGKFVIKTRKTKHVRVTPDMFLDPRKFWSKIPQKDILFNVFATDMIKEIPTFVEVIRGLGIKVYWRKKGASIVEEVK